MLSSSQLNEHSLISPDLERAQEPDELLQLLKLFGFTDQDIAQATNMHARTVRRWKMGVPGTAAAEHLAELRNLVLLLRESGSLTDRGTVFWTRHPNRLLEDYSPLAVLGAGGFRAVREAALCFGDSERGFGSPIQASVLEALQDSQESKPKSAQDRRELRKDSKLTAV